MRKLIIYTAIILATIGCEKSIDVTELNVLPLPQSMELVNSVFTFDGNTGLIINANEEDTKILAEYLAASKFNLKTEEKKKNLKLVLDENINSPEGYVISVNKRGINISAKSGAGLFYAVQTLLQLTDEKNRIPCGVIKDEPQFAYRGLMIDVSRHFFDKEFIKKQIDAISHFKMNRLHLHLTDAAGWRIEIKRYPKLTQFAAWRSPAIWKDWWFGSREYVNEEAKVHTVATLPRMILERL